MILIQVFIGVGALCAKVRNLSTKVKVLCAKVQNLSAKAKSSAAAPIVTHFGGFVNSYFKFF